MNIDWGQAKTPADLAAKALAERRAGASLTRLQFCEVLVAAGILTSAQAWAASKGEWPEPMDGFFDYHALTEDQANLMKMEWSCCVTVQRDHALIIMLEYWLDKTPEEIDSLFGITVSA